MIDSIQFFYFPQDFFARESNFNKYKIADSFHRHNRHCPNLPFSIVQTIGEGICDNRIDATQEKMHSSFPCD